MRILVIGGSGFIGTRLISQWREDGHELVNLDIQQSSTHPDVTVIGDVRTPQDVRSAAGGDQPVDAVVLLAAEHRDDVRPLSLYEEVNVGGARTVVQVCTDLGIDRIVFTSSVAIYGLDVGRPSESSPAHPFNEYGRTKLAAERVLSEWAGQDPGRSLFIVRPCVVFGERNRGNVYSLARQIASRKFLFIGKGANRKAMGYVGNVVGFLATGLAAPAGVQVTNYADTPDLTTRELVDIISAHLGHKRLAIPPIPRPLGMLGGYVFDAVARLTGRTFPISAIRIKKFTAETLVDTSRLQASGYRPPYSLPDALGRTLDAEFPGGRVPADDGEGVYGASQ
ncbi:MAG: NAD-dependent epimerase/dehydratase family protein [Actinomycetales bacterium]